MTFAFRKSLYEEHFEQAIFLQHQRSLLREGWAGEWHRLRDLERRLDAHVDALVLAGPFAVEISEKHVERPTPIASYVSMRVLTESSISGSGSPTKQETAANDALITVLSAREKAANEALIAMLFASGPSAASVASVSGVSADWTAVDMFDALEDGVVDGCSRAHVAHSENIQRHAWQLRLVRELAARGLSGWMARLSGRWRLTEMLVEVEAILETPDSPFLTDALAALCRLPSTRARFRLQRILEDRTAELQPHIQPHIQPFIQTATQTPTHTPARTQTQTRTQPMILRALARSGDPTSLTHCRRLAREAPWAAELLPCLGGGEAHSILVGLFNTPRPELRRSALLGLALAGRPEDLPLFLEHLEIPGEEAIAARALQCLTGESPTEDVTHPPTDEGDVVSERRLSCDGKVWRSILAHRAPLMLRGARYRLGELFDARSARGLLGRSPAPRWIRAATLEEMRFAFGDDAGFEVKDYVEDQSRCLAKSS